MSTDPHALITALIGGHEREYQTSPSFRFALDNFAAVLPAMIEGLLHGCLQNDHQMHEATLAAMNAPPPAMIGYFTEHSVLDGQAPRPTSDPALRGKPGYIWTGPTAHPGEPGSSIQIGRPRNAKFRRLGP